MDKRRFTNFRSGLLQIKGTWKKSKVYPDFIMTEDTLRILVHRSERKEASTKGNSDTIKKQLIDGILEKRFMDYTAICVEMDNKQTYVQTHSVLFMFRRESFKKTS